MLRDGWREFELVNAMLRSSVADALSMPCVEAKREEGQKYGGCTDAADDSTNRDVVVRHTSASWDEGNHGYQR